MAEITAVSVTLTLFLAWRLYVVSKKCDMAEVMLRGIISGKVSVQRTDGGDVILELKRGTND